MNLIQKLWCWLKKVGASLLDKLKDDLANLQERLTLSHAWNVAKEHSFSFFVTALLLLLPEWRGTVTTPWADCLGGGSGLIEGSLRFLTSLYSPPYISICGFIIGA